MVKKRSLEEKKSISAACTLAQNFLKQWEKDPELDETQISEISIRAILNAKQILDEKFAKILQHTHCYRLSNAINKSTAMDLEGTHSPSTEVLLKYIIATEIILALYTAKSIDNFDNVIKYINDNQPLLEKYHDAINHIYTRKYSELETEHLAGIYSLTTAKRQRLIVHLETEPPKKTESANKLARHLQEQAINIQKDVLENRQKKFPPSSMDPALSIAEYFLAWSIIKRDYKPEEITIAISINIDRLECAFTVFNKAFKEQLFAINDKLAKAMSIETLKPEMDKLRKDCLNVCTSLLRNQCNVMHLKDILNCTLSLCITTLELCHKQLIKPKPAYKGGILFRNQAQITKIDLSGMAAVITDNLIERYNEIDVYDMILLKFVNNFCAICEIFLIITHDLQQGNLATLSFDDLLLRYGNFALYYKLFMEAYDALEMQSQDIFLYMKNYIEQIHLAFLQQIILTQKYKNIKADHLIVFVNCIGSICQDLQGENLRKLLKCLRVLDQIYIELLPHQYSDGTIVTLDNWYAEKKSALTKVLAATNKSNDCDGEVASMHMVNQPLYAQRMHKEACLLDGRLVADVNALARFYCATLCDIREKQEQFSLPKAKAI